MRYDKSIRVETKIEACLKICEETHTSKIISKRKPKRISTVDIMKVTKSSMLILENLKFDFPNVYDTNFDL